MRSFLKEIANSVAIGDLEGQLKQEFPSLLEAEAERKHPEKRESILLHWRLWDALDTDYSFRYKDLLSAGLNVSGAIMAYTDGRPMPAKFALARDIAAANEGDRLSGWASGYASLFDNDTLRLSREAFLDILESGEEYGRMLEFSRAGSRGHDADSARFSRVFESTVKNPEFTDISPNFAFAATQEQQPLIEEGIKALMLELPPDYVGAAVLMGYLDYERLHSFTEKAVGYLERVLPHIQDDDQAIRSEAIDIASVLMEVYNGPDKDALNRRIGRALTEKADIVAASTQEAYSMYVNPIDGSSRKGSIVIPSSAEIKSFGKK